MIDYVSGNLKSGLDYYLKAVKVNFQFDVTLVLQILQLLVDLREKENYFKEEQVLYILDRQLEVFFIYTQNHKFKEGEEKIKFLMNFLWQVNEYVSKLFNWIADLKDKHEVFANGKRIFMKWLDFVKDHCGTQAGDEVLGTYVDILKRFQ